MNLNRFLLFCMIIISACSSETKTDKVKQEVIIDSFESALPHGQSLTHIKLSDDDRIKLAQATGKKTDYISPDSLKYLIETDTSGLVIYNFWKLDCSSCDTMVRVLKTLEESIFEEKVFDVIHVNTEYMYPDLINSYIREKEIVDPVYTLQREEIIDWPGYFHNSWEGQLPAILIVNNDDGIRLFYQKSFNLEEMQAVLLPLTL